MVIGNMRYSHFTAQKHGKIRQNIGGFAVLSPNKIIGGIAPAPLLFLSSPTFVLPYDLTAHYNTHIPPS